MNAAIPGAIFIDFDNLYLALRRNSGHNPTDALAKTIQIVGNVISFAQNSRGIIPIIRQAFGDWSLYPDALSELYIMGIKVAHLKAVPSKSSADIELSLSLQEIILTRPDIGAMVVVAGDRDYMPVSLRAMEKARQIIFFSFSDCMSGDLKKLIGQGNCHYLDPKTADVAVNGQVDQAVKTRTAPGDASVRYESQARPQNGSIKELNDNQCRALKAAIASERVNKPKYGSVKLGKFLVVELAAALPEMDHLGRKEVLNSLVEAGLIGISVSESFYGPYTAFTIRTEHPIVKTMLEEPSRDSGNE